MRKSVKIMLVGVLLANLHNQVSLIAMGDGGLAQDLGTVQAFLAAAQAGDIDEIRRQLDAGRNVDVVDSSGSTALMCAADNGQAEIVRFLLERGADINRQSHSGRTALMRVVLGDNTAIVRLLLEKGADLNIRTHGFYLLGCTALIMAANGTRFEMVRLLVERDALCTAADLDRITDPAKRQAVQAMLAERAFLQKEYILK